MKKTIDDLINYYKKNEVIVDSPDEIVVDVEAPFYPEDKLAELELMLKELSRKEAKKERTFTMYMSEASEKEFRKALDAELKKK